MAKRKQPSDSDDQSELPLDGANAANDTSPVSAPASADATAAATSATDAGEASDAPNSEHPPVPKENSPNATLVRHYNSWFLDYASYVILDRAVPHIDDGLKPVQRRILHTLHEMDDGRFNKVANVVGAAMRFHPHGDASIEAALVGIAQRGLLIEPQGNFGNILTGDGAAAARYIEARLTPFAREVVFNAKTTTWQLSYDGRAKEPVTLPVKFPLVLAEGAEGIAVGLSTRILPHNFNDLCRASINHLQGKNFRIFPDFPTGGIADFSEYNNGARGGKVKSRARIEQRTKYLLAITELPFGVTTTSLIDSILAANAKGKLKVRHVDDNTSDKVEILVHLPQGSDPDQVISQLYVFTNCQVSISPAACVIETDDQGNDRPVFLSVPDILKRSTDKTVSLLKQELEIRLEELEAKWHWDSLVRIFIEEKIYKLIETCKTKEAADEAIRKGLHPFAKRLRRPVTDEDITKLGDIPIKRTAAYNRFKADEEIKGIEKEISGTKHNLKHLTAYAIKWFETLQEKYGKGRKRRTEYDEIEQISLAEVVSANQRLYVNRNEGFIGLNWRQHEFVTECTVIDDVLCFMADGTMKVARVADKLFMGRNIIHIALMPKEGDKHFYTMVYQDKKTGKAFAKRFQIGGVTREKLYSLVSSEGSKVVYFHVAKKEADMPAALNIELSGRCSARKKEFEFDAARLGVGARGNKGLTVTEYPIKRVKAG
ncbi:topoisomerase-4 subunit A [Ereboglobus sp. PH5-10]|uniref:DNA gyrase/topoisomerase IV subunit A n=1 Tax=Ereboglobus sp. PH5-10 TaxID=2940629 RepID=UPI002404C257|nr:DNA gyrase/topoisomerase IV subunit A [Ereboglobus sp. PH5-10]MDF9828589.1 topoisomerase-4 subunit A [Ereboglobus sp. PH5-10]